MRSRWRPGARRASALLAGLVAAGSPSAALGATTLDAFDGPASDYSFSNGAEFPGAVGSLSSVPGYQGNALRLDYDFTCSGGVTPCDPQYVGASRAVAFPADTTAVSVWVRQGSGRFSLRVVDATGQTLQLTPTTQLPLETRSSQGWFRLVLPIGSSTSHWGGANDGVLHPPVVSYEVVCDGEGVGSSGFLEIDELVGTADPAEFEGALDPATATLLPAPAGAERLADRLGVNIHFTTDDQALDAAASAGFHWVRMDLAWDAVERTVGNYDFSPWDELLDALEQRGMAADFILDYGNTLYTGAAMTPPRSPAEITAFGDYVAAAVTHFQDRTNLVFEVWNEPDIDGFWGGAPSASEYQAVLEEALNRAHAANPNAQLLTGGLSRPYPRAWEFWDDLLASSTVADLASGLGTHLYLWAPPEQRWADVLTLQERLAVAMPGRAVWNTEWGHSSAMLLERDGVFEPIGPDLQAVWTVRSILTTWWAGLPLHVVYDLRDDGTDPVDPEHHFGMLARDYTDKPAMAAVRTLTDAAAGRTLDGLLIQDQQPPGAHVLRLSGPTDQVFVVWTEAPGQVARFTLPPRVDRVLSVTGAPITATSPTLTVIGEQSPVYVYAPLDPSGAAGGGAGSAGQGVAGGAPGPGGAAGGTAGAVSGGGPSSSSGRDGGCGCRTGQGSGSGGMALVAALAVLASLRRRRGS